MDVEDAIAKARDAVTVKRVYGEPYERDGLVVIPAAAVGGGAGGGGGSEPAEDGGEASSGSGFGFGISARPVGAYVIEGGSARWVPAFDLTRVATQAIVTLAGLAMLFMRRRR